MMKKGINIIPSIRRRTKNQEKNTDKKKKIIFSLLIALYEKYTAMEKKSKKTGPLNTSPAQSLGRGESAKAMHAQNAALALNRSLVKK